MSDSEYMAGIAACLEPQAVSAVRDAKTQIELSTALSLKRIADALNGGGGPLDKLVAALDPENPDGFLRASINCYGEGIGEAIQGQLVRGQRGIDQYEGR